MNNISSFPQYENFETKLSEVFASIIAKKIYYEYAQSFIYPMPISKFDGSSIYNLTLGEQTHSINKNTNYCDSLHYRISSFARSSFSHALGEEFIET